MRLLMTASQIRGLPVVTVQGGEDVAEVRDVIYSPKPCRWPRWYDARPAGLSWRVGVASVLPAEAIQGRSAQPR